MFQVDLSHKSGQIFVAVGVDLTDYYPSIEWDILSAVNRNFSYRKVAPFVNLRRHLKSTLEEISVQLSEIE